MILVLLLHAALALTAPLIVRALGRRAFWILALAPGATTVFALFNTAAAIDGPVPEERLSWIPALGVELAFRLDALSWIMCLVVGGIGALVLIYCSAYFDDTEPGLGRFAGLLTAFAGAMLGIVTTDDLLMLYVFWEITTVLSFLLIGHSEWNRASRASATQALFLTAMGGLAMLGGIVLLGETQGTYKISQLMIFPGSTAWPLVSVAAVLLLVGAATKSALFPVHFWLPGAMAAPTPVSAYLHAAAMVKAGIYLVARMAPAYSTVTAWTVTVLVLGCLTMILGAYRSLRQHDLKLLLAFGTVSQLGFLVVLVGTGTEQAAVAGLTMLVAHAMYKGALFLIVGAIDHSTGTRDLRVLTGLARSMPGLLVASVLAAASMAGLPPLLGFVGKEAVYATYSGSGEPWAPVVLTVLVVGSMLTFAYSARFLWGAFRTQPGCEPTPVHAPGAVLTGVPLVLALGGLIAGPASLRIEPAIMSYAENLPSDGEAVHLGLWHGFSTPLYLSLLTIGVGVALFLARRPIKRAQSAIAKMYGPGGADDVYRYLMRSLDRGSLILTGALQRGSLPLSMSLILGCFVVLVGGSMLLNAATPGDVRWFDSTAQLATAGLVAVATVLAVRSRRRMRAVLLVGVAGYGMSFLFLLFGAPDLALTQFLAETLSLAVLVLVLRVLPSRFEDATAASRIRRAAFGIMVGVVVTWMALTLPQVRTGLPASTGLSTTAVDYGGGSNIVNIILVDVRAWDTMGELSVVVAAATGIASLVFLHDKGMSVGRRAAATMRGRRGDYRSATSLTVAGQDWLTEGGSVHPRRRSLMLEVTVRLLFPVVLLWSLFLLFSGHNNPGGGFAAGLVGGLALLLRYLAGGRAELRSAAPVSPGVLMGIGLFLSAGNGLVSMLVGGDVLQTWVYDIPIPLLGKLHLVTSVFFDIGVYFVVVGLVLDILTSLGAGIDEQGARGPDDPVTASIPVVSKDDSNTIVRMPAGGSAP